MLCHVTCVVPCHFSSIYIYIYLFIYLFLSAIEGSPSHTCGSNCLTKMSQAFFSGLYVCMYVIEG